MSPQKKITIFLSLTVLFSALSYIPIIGAGTANVQGGIFVLTMMWSPGLAAILTQLVATRSLRGLGWGLGSTRWLGVAYILPILYALPIYAFTWISGLGTLLNPYDFSTLTKQFSSPNIVSAIAVYALIKATKGVAEALLFSLGEEIGWRGLFVPELAKVTSFTRTALISGVVWAAWHIPVILFADYHNGSTPVTFAAACFTVMIIGISFPFAWLTLKSRSLWTAVLLHTTHNVFIQGFFDRLTGSGSITPYITGEFGIGLAVTGLVVAYVFWQMRPDKSLSPSKVLTASASQG
ncbi:MAG: CPBP family intramembrane metalloprotease [Caldilineaceae bacterium]|nr:CPBP family intramembrane metalloprotease [Caldilineaceae bacterium]